jgi:hypothetical protein
MRVSKKPPVAGVTEREIRLRCYELQCDPRTYRKELAHPGTVTGGVGLLIRRDIALLRDARPKTLKRGR